MLLLAPATLWVTQWLSQQPQPTGISVRYEALRFTVWTQTSTLAWSMSDIIRYWWFEVLFGCQGERQHQKCDNYIFVCILYSLIVATAGVLLVPVLHRRVHLLKSLSGFYSNTLLPRDVKGLHTAQHQTEMTVKILAIVVGYAYTRMPQAECVSDITPSCPLDITFSSVMQYLLVVILISMMIAAIYHMVIESHRRYERAMLVFALAEGDSTRFFQGADVNGDNVITADELLQHVTKNGLEPKHFVATFKEAELLDGKADDQIGQETLVQEFAGYLFKQKAMYEQGNDRINFSLNQLQQQPDAKEALHALGLDTCSGINLTRVP
eukprot:TRINITY_DN9186_c0_g1_i3.p1 TRINITY_DN9186_c0_g1~~TRINITY_DN9186_c0_g1_i3.p1  ORF type:complete len:324 (-),score=64.84 TRINITY_DN9186_c0_g1_i3:196-1167(-)